MKNKRELSRKKRHVAIRLHLRGDNEKPRLVVRRSLTNLYAQLIDDISNKTLLSFSTRDKAVVEKHPYGGNIKAAICCGEVGATKIKEKGFKKIVFDRAGYLYHGRVKAFADALRKGGLEF